MRPVIQQTIRLPDGTVIEIRDDQARAMIAEPFDDRTFYPKDKVVIYENKLYRFYSDHSPGKWIGTDCGEINASGALSDSIADSVIGILTDKVATSADIAAMFD